MNDHAYYNILSVNKGLMKNSSLYFINVTVNLKIQSYNLQLYKPSQIIATVIHLLYIEYDSGFKNSDDNQVKSFVTYMQVILRSQKFKKSIMYPWISWNQYDNENLIYYLQKRFNASPIYDKIEKSLMIIMKICKDITKEDRSSDDYYKYLQNKFPNLYRSLKLASSNETNIENYIHAYNVLNKLHIQ
ncbi:unnamed protein product [Gordionus sp. m RMFG-2023]